MGRSADPGAAHGDGRAWLFPAFLTYPMLVALGRIRDTLARA